MKTILALAFMSTLLMAGCDTADSRVVDETRTAMVGTWQRDSDTEGTNSDRVLELNSNGKFTERVLVTKSDGRSEMAEYSGEWSFDGTNLKRKFLQENGRQFAGGKLRYATFPLVSVTATQLTLNDSINGKQVGFRRAQ